MALPQSNGQTIDVILSPTPAEVVVSELARLFPQQTFQQTDELYTSLQRSYWSGTQKDLKPRCFFQPHNATELANAVALCVKARCPFGVKSGGHGHFAGQSCLDGGIQFDLVRLNTIKIDRERGSVFVGTGCTWRSVYETLEPQGFLAVGGRSADVGVGGFLLGGGISFYAAERGWGVDNVRSFEVVLSNGTVVTASRESEPCLFNALRGGGPNFGIITSFELDLVPYSGMWGGYTLIDSIHAQDAIDAYADFIPKLDADPKGHTIIIFDYAAGHVDVRQYLAYTQPVEDLPMFDRLRKVPTIESTLGLTDYSALASNIADLQNGHGLRHAVSTMTVKLDREILNFAYDAYLQGAATVADYAYGCLEFHALPRSPHPEDNVYGLKKTDDRLIAIMLAFSTEYKRYDYELIALQQRILGKIQKFSESRHAYHPFLFANYSGPFQDVLGSYGDVNTRFLSEVAESYDPERIMQTLQPGGFKLGSFRRSTRL